MSWEEIQPPPRVPPITSGPTRFVLGRPTYGHNQPKVVAGHMIEEPPRHPVGPLLASAHAMGSDSVVPPGLNGASHVRNSIPTLPLPSSRAGIRVGLGGRGPQTSKPFLNSSVSGGHRSSPLFPSHISREMRHSAADQTVLIAKTLYPPRNLVLMPHLHKWTSCCNPVQRRGRMAKTSTMTIPEHLNPCP
jgi:hypothetical protein